MKVKFDEFDATEEEEPYEETDTIIVGSVDGVDKTDCEIADEIERIMVEARKDLCLDAEKPVFELWLHNDGIGTDVHMRIDRLAS